MLVSFPLFQGRVIREMWLGTSSFFFSFSYFYYAMTLTKISLKYLLADFLQWDQKKISGYIKAVAKGSPIFLKIFAFIPKENLFTNNVPKTS